jgi:hypothetical protein
VSESSICLKTQYVRGQWRSDVLELREDSESGEDSG